LCSSGRIHRVKVRGNRVHLGEIEAAIAARRGNTACIPISKFDQQIIAVDISPTTDAG
jgi:hypothetical protein